MIWRVVDNLVDETGSRKLSLQSPIDSGEKRFITAMTINTTGPNGLFMGQREIPVIVPGETAEEAFANFDAAMKAKVEEIQRAVSGGIIVPPGMPSRINGG